MTTIVKVITHRPDLAVPRPPVDWKPPIGPSPGTNPLRQGEARDEPAIARRATAGPPPSCRVQLLVFLRNRRLHNWPTTPPRLRRSRCAACQACELFVANAHRGLGECGAKPGPCGKFKAWVPREQCPHPNGSRWSPLSA